jgi:hypothetical protein
LRIAAISVLVVATLIGVVLLTGDSTSGGAAERPPSAAAAIAEVEALHKAEVAYYREHGRYSNRLADLFAGTRLGSDIVMNAGGLDIHLDTSTDGKTVIVRVNSPAITLSRVLVGGQETGRTCDVLAPATGDASCP